MMISRALKNHNFLKSKLCFRPAISTAFATKSKVSNKKRLDDLNLATGSKFSPGKVYEGFMCKQVEHIKDFDMTAYVFQHETVGTEYLHLDRNDSNNVFSINFRTTPFDSTGIPHILEHNVLCGSDKFPVRDPFFKMTNRSLATFMNAFTGPDYTMYPFSSANEVDYRNLQKIYLDAAFSPNLRYIDFLQEGWRLEYKDLNDNKSDLILKGVVYNEMKGAFSENSSVFAEALLHNLLPDHTYGYVSGGDPLEIPNLTHTNLVKFHEEYYHPSNARFFSYGNNKLEPTLKYINEHYMKDYMKIDTDYSKIPPQKRWTVPRKCSVVSRYDSMGAPMERQNQMSISYLMCDVTEVYESFVVSIIAEMLVRGPNSAFYKSLIEPNISGGFNTITGYENQMRDGIFSVGLQDLLVEDFERVEKIYDETIDRVITYGFSKEHIESVLHNVELQIRHQTPKFGLGILFNCTPLWNHDGATNLIEAMKVSNLINRFRENLSQNPRYLEDRVEHYFRQNKHRMTLTMTPDPEYEEKQAQAEMELLKKKVCELTADDRDKIYRDGLILSEVQKTKENADVLPCLQLEDISKEIEKFDLVQENIGQVPTQFCLTNTNDIVYYNGIFDASSLSAEQQALLPLFTAMINQFGTKTHNFRDFDQMIQMKTSGLSFALHFSDNLADNSKYEIGISFGSYALNKNHSDMFKIIQELLVDHNMNDKSRLEMLLVNYVSNLAVGIPTAGHGYAMQCASGLVTESAKLKEMMSGIGHISFMKNLMSKNSPDEILTKLRDIGQKIFDNTKLRSAVNVEAKSKDVVSDTYSKFVTSLPKLENNRIDGPAWNSSSPLQSSCLQHIMNIPVNYCAKAIITVPFQDKDFAPLKILAKILSSKYLLPVVREQNGAYGAGAKIANDGLFCFYSYRDPNSTKTLEAFDESGKWFDETKSTFDDQLLFEAKLGVLQQLDAPIGPGAKGMDEFRSGLTREIFANHRNHVLSVTIDELEAVNEKYLKNKELVTGKCVLGPENDELTNSKDEKWIINKAE